MRFLLDENVRAELDGFPRANGCDVRRLPKGAPDRLLAPASRAEERVIVTNDEDFAAVPAGTAFGVVLPRLPQHDSKGLLAAFQRLLNGAVEWKGHVIVLGPERWRSSRPLTRFRVVDGISLALQLAIQMRARHRMVPVVGMPARNGTWPAREPERLFGFR